MSDTPFQIRINPKPPPTDPAEIHFKNAWRFRKQKRFDDAIREFHLSLEYQPDKAATHFNLGLVYDQVDDGKNAVAHARRAVELFEAGGDAKNLATARRTLQRFLEKYPAASGDSND